jgi:hypothetical protein
MPPQEQSLIDEETQNQQSESTKPCLSTAKDALPGISLEIDSSSESESDITFMPTCMSLHTIARTYQQEMGFSSPSQLVHPILDK